MTKHLLPSFAALLLSATPALADEDTDIKEGETPQQHADRLAAQAGHYAAGVRVHVASALDDSFNFIGLDLGGRYNVTDMINVGARIPLAVSKPDGFSVFGGAAVRAELRLGATIGVAADVGFGKEGMFALSAQDAPLYAEPADYTAGAKLGVWVRAKAGPTYLSVEPAFVYQAEGQAEAIEAVHLPVTAMFRAGNVARAGVLVGIYTGDDFKFGADEGARIATGLVADIKVSSIALQLGAGFASLLTDDMAAYTSVGKSVYVTVGLMYAK